VIYGHSFIREIASCSSVTRGKPFFGTGQGIRDVGSDASEDFDLWIQTISVQQVQRKTQRIVLQFGVRITDRIIPDGYEWLGLAEMGAISGIHQGRLKS